MEIVMSKAAKINKAINWGIWIAGAYFIGTAIAGAIKRKREGINGIGKVERIKRRVYKEVSLAQGRGVDFSKKFADLTKAEKDALKLVGNEVGWKQSKRAIDSGKSYVESYYNSLRRAWNAVSGIVGIGKAYDVKDANGNVCLTWIEDAAAHVKHEPEPVEPAKPAKKSKADEQNERAEFAERYLNDYLAQHHDEQLYWIQPMNEHDGTRADIIIKEFVDGKLKLKKRGGRYTGLDYEIYLQGKWYNDYSLNNKVWSFAFGLLNNWENKGFYNPQLDKIRRAVLDRSQHMQVVTEKGDGVIANYDRPYVTGDERYNYLPLINYVVVVAQRYERGGDVYYPVRSYPTEADAMSFVKTKYRDHGKVVPIFDINIDRISGLNFS